MTSEKSNVGAARQKIGVSPGGKIYMYTAII
jgi:hypothetical protein